MTEPTQAPLAAMADSLVAQAKAQSEADAVRAFKMPESISRAMAELPTVEQMQERMKAEFAESIAAMMRRARDEQVAARQRMRDAAYRDLIRQNPSIKSMTNVHAELLAVREHNNALIRRLTEVVAENNRLLAELLELRRAVDGEGEEWRDGGSDDD